MTTKMKTMWREQQHQQSGQKIDAPPLTPGAAPTPPQEPEKTAAPSSQEPPAPAATAGDVELDEDEETVEQEPEAQEKPKAKESLQLGTEQLSRRLARARRQGRELAERERDTEAQKAGFKDFEHMVQVALRAHHSEEEPQPRSKKRQDPAEPAATDAPVAPVAYEAMEQTRALQTRLHQEQRARKKLEKQISAMRAEYALRDAAARAGVQDVEFALHLIRNKYATLSPEERASFDEATAFQSLREERPALFAPAVRPASTGNAGGPPTTKAPAAAAPRVDKPAVSEEVDARKMTSDQLKKRLAQLGIKNPTIGL